MLNYNPNADPRDVDWKKLPSNLDKVIKRIKENLFKQLGPAFSRPIQKQYTSCYIDGLVSNIDRKNEEKIALNLLGPHKVRGLQRYMIQGAWNEVVFKDILQKEMAKVLKIPDGMITIDESDFPKKGTHSAGVARQYCGALGKVENCQAGVFLGYTGNNYGLLDHKLYLHKKWFTPEYKDRFKKCHIPKNSEYATKAEIALTLLENIVNKKLFKVSWFGADSAFGNNRSFLSRVEELGFKYFVGISKQTKIWPTNPNMVKAQYKGRGIHSSQLVPEGNPDLHPVMCYEYTNSPECKWRKVKLGEGSKGPIWTEVCCKRVTFYIRRNDPQEGWLIIRRWSNGDIKYYKSNAPANISFKELLRAMTMRWPIEQIFEMSKSNLGMDHYETRSWIGWHRHMTLVSFTYLMLLKIHQHLKKKFQISLYHK